MRGVTIRVEPYVHMHERVRHAYIKALTDEIERHFADPDVQRRLTAAFFELSRGSLADAC